MNENLILIKYISAYRIEKYLKFSNNHTENAVNKYKENIDKSANMYKLLSYFEIFLRNFINDCLEKYNKNWIINLEKINQKIIDEEKKKDPLKMCYFNKKENRLLNKKEAEKKHKENIENLSKYFEDQIKTIYKIKTKCKNKKSLIGEMTFGFWVNLFSKKYQNEFWNGKLSTIFVKTIKRSFIEGKLTELNNLRNRIAHHECIILYQKNNLVYYYNLIIDIIKNMNLECGEWLEKEMSQDLFN